MENVEGSGRRGNLTRIEDSRRVFIPCVPSFFHVFHDSNVEIEKGLSPENAADRNNVAADGYTMLEKYLNSVD